MSTLITELTDTVTDVGHSVEVCVPASTSNLGAGFDCFGLSLQLYLTVRAVVLPESAGPLRLRCLSGEENSPLPRTAENLIFRAMSFAAEREGLTLPSVRLAVSNEIPLGRGLGSSAAAIVAGISLCGLLCGRELSPDTVLRYATELEGHGDNVAASLHGGWVVTCVKEDGDVIALKQSWPSDLKVIVISPHATLETNHARAVLPKMIAREDAVHNIQRAALFGAALAERAYDHLWEAMRDRLHQAHRPHLIPGLAEALATPRLPGLAGLALSGAGPSVVALAWDNFNEIGEMIASSFETRGIRTTVRLLEVDHDGIRTRLTRKRRHEITEEL